MRAIVHVLKGDLREDYQNLEIRTGGSPSCPQYYLMTQVPLSQSIPIKEKYWTWTGRKERVIGQKTHEDLELAMAYPCQSTLTVKVNNRKLIAASEKLAKRAKVKLCIDLEGKLTI
jgi:hypothetical protein